MRQPPATTSKPAPAAVQPMGGASSPMAACTGPKLLKAGAVCGGINLCGSDLMCGTHCCEEGSGCIRSSAFTWSCEREVR
jgi:hypothetical protein